MAMIRSPEKSSPRLVSSPSHTNRMRDWSNLGEGPAGLVAERLLADDVADYIRFRAVCSPWRWCCTDPRAHGILDRRFHPRNRILLREPVAAPDHRRLLLNVSTGQCMRTRLPELSHQRVFGPTAEGLLVLLDRSSYAVRLLNPLTGQVTDLPPATTLVRLNKYKMSSTDDSETDDPTDYPTEESDLGEEFKVLAAGLADDTTFVVYFGGVGMLVVAKSRDECWTLVDDQRSLDDSLPISFNGRFYCTTDHGLMVVDTTANKPPQLVLTAELPKVVPRRSSTFHLVENGGELILVYRNFRRGLRTITRKGHFQRIKDSVEYKVYRVDLKTMDTKPILRLGGRAIFFGPRSALSVSSSLFPSLKSDSIYVGLDLKSDTYLKNDGVYCLMDGTSEPCGIFEQGGFDGDMGPWGIDDYLSWYTTDAQNVGSLTTSIYDDD